MYFIEYHAFRKAGHKSQRVIACGSEHRAVVEGDIGASCIQLAGKGGFANLARAKDAHDRGIVESVQHLLLQIAWVKSRSNGAA
ncbi:hypothetical protein D9M68_693320 [compost metagenome]